MARQESFGQGQEITIFSFSFSFECPLWKCTLANEWSDEIWHSLITYNLCTIGTQLRRIWTRIDETPETLPYRNFTEGVGFLWEGFGSSASFLEPGTEGKFDNVFNASGWIRRRRCSPSRLPVDRRSPQTSGRYGWNGPERLVRRRRGPIQKR